MTNLKLYRSDFRKKIDYLYRIISLAVILLPMMGCSVTSLQCGTDGDSSFINLNTTPKILSQNARTMAELCSFAFQQEKT